ncbi:SIR2 family protein [Micromonospora sp. NPDC005298]|uniref:SIR2 family protein n=1 Tax=Micromonospora sp. NPDC005298 TaxID=3156873 RepID=UPI0033A8C3EE
MTDRLPSVTRHADLFVFAGAGASYAPPAALPLFDPMRDAILRQLGLADYLDQPGLKAIIKGLAPEPFMHALKESGVDVQDWLSRTLRTVEPAPPRPNAVHVALAQLAAMGCAVWTVNFDTLVEEADADLRAVSWPADPAEPGEIHKPHGSLPGDLIVTARQVLVGLDQRWREALTEAVRHRVVAFIGYSGRDFDFQPLWDGILAEATAVMWFYRPEDGVDEEGRLARLLRSCATKGTLFTVPSPNPSREFVAWCTDNGLVAVDRDLVDQLPVTPPPRPFPTLGGNLALAQVQVRGVLGDWRGAVRAGLRTLPRNPDRLKTLKQLGAQVVNNAGRWVTVPLGVIARTPLLPDGKRKVAESKLIAAHSRHGDHQRVLRGTDDLDDRSPSTLLALRASSLRMTGNLDEAARVGARAYERARQEVDPNQVRVAGAAFQRAYALMWAGRLDECRRCVDEDLRPSVAIAANRMVAWADYLEGSLALHEGDDVAAAGHYHLSELRFRGEGLLDGVVTVLTARLTLTRRTDPGGFPGKLAELDASRSSTAAFYTRDHPFSTEAVILERAEYTRVHEHDLDRAAQLYRTVADASAYPIQRCSALLGAGLVAVEQGASRTDLHAARDLAAASGVRVLVRHAEAALVLADGARPDEVFFC